MSVTTSHKNQRPARKADLNSAMTNEKSICERLRALIVWLGLTELAWIGYWLLSSSDTTPGYVATVVVWIVVMLAWLVLASYLGAGGFFLKGSRWLSNLVGVGLVVAFGVTLFGVTQDAREGLMRAATETSHTQLISIHILRLLAIGTVIKYLHGELPLHFVLLGSLPDVLFGISAAVVTAIATNGPLEPNFLLVWHLIGFSVFIGAGISMFLSVPSPLRIYHNKPDASIVFQFPMALAPNFTVPLFMIAHLFALVKLLV